MQPVASATGERVNWINYKTGIKHIYFRMHVGKGAGIAIELAHPDDEMRTRYFERFVQHKSMLHSLLGEKWHWEQEVIDESGKGISRISNQLQGVNIFNQGDWPAIISFLKPRILALDEFWSIAREAFD